MMAPVGGPAGYFPKLRSPDGRGAGAHELPQLERLAGAGARSSIMVEFFGPPAAGKTTLAFAVADALQTRGIEARVISSARAGGRVSFAASRLPASCRAAAVGAAKTVGAVRALVPGAVPPSVDELMALMLPGGWTRRLRLRRYAAELHRSWQDARQADGVVIFDQAFLNLLCSLAVMAGSVDRRMLSHAVALVPASDIAVRLEAPRALLDARLQQRRDRQGALERAFENDLEKGLVQGEISETVDMLLRRGGRRPLVLRSHDASGLAEAAERIARECCSRMQDRPSARAAHTW